MEEAHIDIRVPPNGRQCAIGQYGQSRTGRIGRMILRARCGRIDPKLAADPRAVAGKALRIDPAPVTILTRGGPRDDIAVRGRRDRGVRLIAVGNGVDQGLFAEPRAVIGIALRVHTVEVAVAVMRRPGDDIAAFDAGGLGPDLGKSRRCVDLDLVAKRRAVIAETP